MFATFVSGRRADSMLCVCPISERLGISIEYLYPVRRQIDDRVFAVPAIVVRVKQARESMLALVYLAEDWESLKVMWKLAAAMPDDLFIEPAKVATAAV